MIALLVEDNPQKRKDLHDYYVAQFPQDNLCVESSLISGLRTARERRPKFIMVDMTLPNYPPEQGSAVHAGLLAFAGKEFVMRVGRMNFETKIIVVSMFETFGLAPNLITLQSLDAELSGRYPQVYGGAVHYSPSIIAWQNEIKIARESLEV